jgi:hypothetical protein
MTRFNPLENTPAGQTFAKESRPAPPVYRPDTGKVQPKIGAPSAYRPSAIQPYKPKGNEKSKIVQLRNKFIGANNDYDSYYGPIFDQKVKDAASMEEINEFVKNAETAHSRKATVTLPPLPPHSPPYSAQIPKQSAPTPAPKPEKKKGKKTFLDLSGPPPPVNWGAAPSSVTSPQQQPPNSGPVMPVPPLVSQVSVVDTLIRKVQNWNGASDKGKQVLLTPPQAVQLMNGLEKIATYSGKNHKFYVRFSEGEKKYNGHVCIKAIAGYSGQVAQATAHCPTYHFEVTNLNSLDDVRKLS